MHRDLRFKRRSRYYSARASKRTTVKACARSWVAAPGAWRSLAVTSEPRHPGVSRSRRLRVRWARPLRGPSGSAFRAFFKAASRHFGLSMNSRHNLPAGSRSYCSATAREDRNPDLAASVSRVPKLVDPEEHIPDRRPRYVAVVQHRRSQPAPRLVEPSGSDRPRSSALQRNKTRTHRQADASPA
jgi:hypothetical protein